MANSTTRVTSQEYAPRDIDRRPRLRVAVVATPRSGTTWLRSLLGSLYGLEDVVCDQPTGIPWDKLPERCVLHLHWSPMPEFRNLLRRHDVRAITMARHPLDVLISILHFCTTWPGTSRWFGGRCGNEDSIRGALPASDEFRKYASSLRAQALTSVTRDWWSVTDCQKMCYEDLVRDPLAEFTRLALSLEPVEPEAIRNAVAGNSFERLKPRAHNQHYWRGTPGEWKRFLPASLARELALVHTASFELLDYTCEPDETVTGAQADMHWLSLEMASLRQELMTTRLQLHGQVQRHEDRLSQFEPIRELGPRAIWVAQRLHRLAASLPVLTAPLVWCCRAFARRAA